MKKRNPSERSSELKGVVKKMAGRLTNRPDLEQEGDAEMLGDETRIKSGPKLAANEQQLNPDPHRRG
jgi:uncharacterized protein YjbJ (UPF0337 family)